MPITFGWAEFLHWMIRANRTDRPPDTRRRWFGITLGFLERGLVTAFILWLPNAAGPFIGAWLVVKAATGWGDFGREQTSEPARARYAVVLLASLGSIIWAVGWGIWWMPPPRSN